MSNNHEQTLLSLINTLSKKFPYANHAQEYIDVGEYALSVEFLMDWLVDAPKPVELSVNELMMFKSACEATGTKQSYIDLYPLLTTDERSNLSPEDIRLAQSYIESEAQRQTSPKRKHWLDKIQDAIPISDAAPTLNTLFIEKHQTEYADAPYGIFCLDSVPLDILLNQYESERDLLGLVPAPSWLIDEKEKAFAVERLLPKNAKTIAPVLVCPDDIDLGCTVVVAEVEWTEDAVIWHRLGLNRPMSDDINDWGTSVNWFTHVPTYRFNPEQYQQCINTLANET